MKKLVSVVVERLKPSSKTKSVLKLIGVMILGAITGLVIAAAALWSINTLKETRRKESAELCSESYKMLCVKVFDCGVSPSVSECDQMVEQQKFCEKKEFPPNQLIKECTNKVREISCMDDVPPECLTFME